MWRLVIVTFGFLGWSFYVLSGGADYEPRLQSIQARAKLDDIRPVARPGSETVMLASAPAEDDARVSVTLAAATPPKDVLVDESEMPKAEALTRPATETELSAIDATDDAVRLAIAAEAALQDVLLEEGGDAPAPEREMLWVDGNVVNMRAGPGTSFDRVARLTRGTEVAVLEDPGTGWLKLEVTGTGEIGWMADWLLTTPY